MPRSLSGQNVSNRSPGTRSRGAICLWERDAIPSGPNGKLWMIESGQDRSIGASGTLRRVRNRECEEALPRCVPWLPHTHSRHRCVKYVVKVDTAWICEESPIRNGRGTPVATELGSRTPVPAFLGWSSQGAGRLGVAPAQCAVQQVRRPPTMRSTTLRGPQPSRVLAPAAGLCAGVVDGPSRIGAARPRVRAPERVPSIRRPCR
jgi:hypothetical protein